MILEAIALTLAGIHFTIPIAYYFYMKKKYFYKPWNLKIDENYKPKATIIIPTYNEAKLIQTKLDNIYQQDYPKNLTEIIIVDSNSNDGTVEIAESWILKHKDANIKIIREEERKGKANALNEALKHAKGEVIVITDVDSLWEKENTLRNAIKYLSDPSIGAVSCIKDPLNDNTKIESSYRKFYNVLRVSESKAYSTPIFHGELAVFRRDILNKLGGFPTYLGADDSHTATLIALNEHRSIIPEDIRCKEITPMKDYSSWRIRRAQHLIQHFIKTLTIEPKTPKQFKSILNTETFLHLINPWILFASLILLLASAFMLSTLAIIILALGILLFFYRTYRTWITTQAFLIIASIKNLFNKEIVWIKQHK